MTYYMYKDTQGYWRWLLEGANNRKIAKSGEIYYNETACFEAITLVKGSADAPVKKRNSERLVRI
ncbi:MAG TPA: DUF1508 domain-containing protein [Opitutaceae bacterium]|nr:DUF1508 domain-containing protein [Opitutaceae bacterium]